METTQTQNAPPSSNLNARQRKQVYMHSSIFDDGGPSSTSNYSTKSQDEVYQGLPLTGYGFNPELRVPNPADMKQTQNFGHNAVFPTNTQRKSHDYETQEIYNPQHRQNDMKMDNDDMRVIKSCPQHSASLPKEYWAYPDVFMSKKSDDRLGWKDIRNELTREGKNANKRQSARELKHYELSSSLFDQSRMQAQPKSDSKDVLLSSSAHFLHEDSSGKTNATSQAKADALSSTKRFRENLRVSENHGLQASALARDYNPATTEITEKEENPRRRSEKNFSDILGSNPEPRAKIVNRVEASSTQNCSWLDARSEICYRNKNPTAVQSGGEFPHERWKKELGSQIFEKTNSTTTTAGPAVRIDPTIRACYDTTDLMTTKSELARSQRKVPSVHTNGNQFLKSAFGRKQLNLSSNDINEAVGRPSRDVEQESEMAQTANIWKKAQENNNTTDLYEKQLNGVPLRQNINFNDHHSAARIKQFDLRGCGNILA